MKNNTGVSIIVYAQNEGLLIDRFLKTFFETNTHQPVEFIILGQGFTGRSEEDINQYATRAFIRHIKCSWNASIVASYNNAVKKTRYPYLLFLMDEYVFASDLLPYALDKLADSFVGAVERHRDGDSENMLAGKETGAQYPGSSRAFLFCRKADFEFIGGFSEQYAPGLKSDDCYLELRTRLNNKCACIKDLPAQPRKDVAKLRILFVLPQPLDSNCGYHVERLASGLQEHGAECIAAVPQKNVMSQKTREKSADTGLPPAIRHSSLHAYTYGEIQNNGISFSDGRGPDIIHAWTPREGVRQFVASLGPKYPCPVVIHLEDNEEYLTETAVGLPFFELEKLSQEKLDKIIPKNRYHPIHGRKWLEDVQGLTMIIDTLEKFNFHRVPSMTILPPYDERLFYPRPINWELRKKLQIPENHLVLVYTGNVHAGNRDEVLSLYKAVQLLNLQGHPTTLIRTGFNSVLLDDEDDSWIKDFEKPLGWINREELPEIMAAADMFVQPGKPGPFNDYRVPCKLPEYFAMCRPVILPRTNLGLKVECGLEGYVLDRTDAEGIAEAVKEIVTKKYSETLPQCWRNYYYNRKHLLNLANKDLEHFYRLICNQISNKSSSGQLDTTFSYFQPVNIDKESFKISVITASYNSWDYLERAIKSVLIQDYMNYEHIVIDGGSTDNSLDILKKYPHLVWISEPDEGQADAMNKGFNISTGNVIVYLNSDDFFYEGAFSAIIPEFVKGAQFVVGNIKVVSERLGSEFINYPRTAHAGMLRHWEPNAFCHNPLGYFYTRNVQIECPFNKNNASTMDLEFLLDASKKFIFHKIEFLLGCYMDSFGTKTHTTQIKPDYWSNRTFHYVEKYLAKMPEEFQKIFIEDRRKGYSEQQRHMDRLAVIQKFLTKNCMGWKVDIVLQATGNHAWGVGEGWVNASKDLNVLNRVFAPKAEWGDSDVTDDDGLAEYLQSPDGNMVLLMGMDWHSQMLHTNEEWRRKWLACPSYKILYIQESVLNFEKLTGEKDMLNAICSAMSLVDACIYTDPNDKILMESFDKPAIWLPFGVDTSVYCDYVDFESRMNRAFFRGKVLPFTKDGSEYSERRELLEALLDKGLVEHVTYLNGKVLPEDLNAEFNKYRIAVNLPSVFAGHPTRVTEAMAAGCALITAKTHNPENDDMFGDGKDLLYYETKEELVSAVERLCRDEAFARQLSRHGKATVCFQYSLVAQLSKVINWVQACNKQSSSKRRRIAFIDHYYHRKTRSSWFFLQFLSQFFDVDIYWDYSPRGDKQPNGDYIRQQGYHFIIVWQCIHSFQTLRALHGQRVIGVPMYDNSGGFPSNMFLPNMEYISFSSHMHKKLIQYGCKSTHMQYYSDPASFTDYERDFFVLRGFYWQRTNTITWDTIRKLIGTTSFASLHVHIDLDSKKLRVSEFPTEWSGMSITRSSWFESRSEYYEQLKSSNVFFVPRISEGIGMSFLEAMSLGMCVVAPDCPTMNEYIKHNVNGLLYDVECPVPLDFSNAEALGRYARRSIEEGRIVWLDQIMGLCANLTGMDPVDIDISRSFPQEKDCREFNLPANVREISTVYEESIQQSACNEQELCLESSENNKPGDTEICDREFVPSGHFYSPIVDRKFVAININTIYDRSAKVSEVILSQENQFNILEIINKHKNKLNFPIHKDQNWRYYYKNNFFSLGDAQVLASLMLEKKPTRIIEVGSGYSSSVMLDINEKYISDSIELIFIDPYPDRLNTLLKNTDCQRVRIIEDIVQRVDLSLFTSLQERDILFIDSSHVSKTGSDVNHLIFNVLPLLNPGVLVHFHDVPYPFEYPKSWVLEEGRSWNEVYILRALLMYNEAWKVLYWGSYMKYAASVDWNKYPKGVDGCFGIWIYKNR